MKIAVVGTNFITVRFLEAARLHKEFELAAVCGSSVDKAAAFAAGYGNVPAYGDYCELASLEGLEGVYIASPNQLHCPMTLFFLEAGIPVLCEKPLAPSLAEARQMVEVSHKHGTLLIKAIVPMFIPNLARLREYLPRIGTVRKAVLSFCQYSSRYDRYRAGTVENAFDPRYMGGSLLDIGLYPLYHAMALWGKPDSTLASGNMLSSGVDGSGTALLCYEGMEAVIIHSKTNNTCLQNEIQGEDGSLLYNSGSNPTEIWYCPRGGERELITVPQYEERMYYELDEFIRCIKSGEIQSPLAPHAQSLEVYEVTDEIRRQIGYKLPVD